MDRYLICILAVLMMACSRSNTRYLLDSSNLRIEKIGDHSYLHTSYFKYKKKSIQCNGVFSVFGSEVIILDSPTDNAGANELLDYLYDNFSPTRIVAIPNHFHPDCTGGFEALLDHKVIIYAYSETIRQMENQELATQLIPFDTHLDLQLGNGKGVILNRYFGPAHTSDNIASYILPDSILFGGCMVKSLEANKGNLADADTLRWSQTITDLKQGMFGDAQLVVPGHGKCGGVELLDYTIQLFEN